MNAAQPMPLVRDPPLQRICVGLFHLPNILVGAEVGPTLVQVVQTAVVGVGIYALRRTTGLLLPCMLLHGVYDYLVLQGNWDTIATALF